MPHVEIKCFAGRDDEMKTQCAKAVAKAVAETLGCNESSVSVAVTDIPKDDWKEKVWDVDIKPQMNELYKKPEYSCD